MQYSYFGSILTIGAMIGAITCGPIADYFGRKMAMRFSSTFCVAGWLAIYLAKRNINSFDSVSGAFIIGTVLRWRILALTAKKGREKEFETPLQKLHQPPLHILKAMRFLCILGFCIRIGPRLHNNRDFILSVGYSQTPHKYISQITVMLLPFPNIKIFRDTLRETG
ncbi:hypothetical protein Peur_011688 [Populus x canadensis]